MGVGKKRRRGRNPSLPFYVGGGGSSMKARRGKRVKELKRDNNADMGAKFSQGSTGGEKKFNEKE